MRRLAADKALSVVSCEDRIRRSKCWAWAAEREEHNCTGTALASSEELLHVLVVVASVH